MVKKCSNDPTWSKIDLSLRLLHDRKIVLDADALDEYDTIMENELIAVQNLKELQDSGKQWLEGILGRQLRDNQQVYIMVFTPGIEPNATARRNGLANWERITSSVEQHLQENGVTGEEFDAAVDETMEQVRLRL
jgi:hypothetical protein